jgi:hypothetical protein
MLFGTQIHYLPFFKEFWNNNVFVITLLCLNGISALYMIFYPNDRSKKIESELAALSKSWDR